jgi:hypothetical protein
MMAGVIDPLIDSYGFRDRLAGVDTLHPHVKDAFTLLVLARRRITFEGAMLDVPMWWPHAPLEEHAKRAKGVKLFTRSIGKFFQIRAHFLVDDLREQFCTEP